MKVRFFPFTVYHGKSEAGSTKIRVDNLIKYWPDAGIYRFGDAPDVMVYQKVYSTFDYKVPLHFPATRILDVCDPDFRDSPDIFLKETMDHMDAVVVPNINFQKFLQQMTQTKVHLIKDRFDLNEFPPLKRHKGTAKTVVWFGYSHNAELLKFAIPSLEKRGMKLRVISNEDPNAYRWANSSKGYLDNYTYVKYRPETIYSEIQKGDVCILPDGHRPFDKFKSENRTIISQLCGVPVAKTAEELDELKNADARTENINTIHGTIRTEYDVRQSVTEYQELIKEIREIRHDGNV